MGTWTRLRKLTAIGTLITAGVGGGAVYLYLNQNQNNKIITVKRNVHNNEKNNWKSPDNNNNGGNNWNAWDFNWDQRDTTELDRRSSECIRHLILIRHGHYNIKGTNDSERYLTELGCKQANFTGQRLKALNIQWDKMIRSTFTRAQETAKIISESLPDDIRIEDCSMIVEGSPIPPEPPTSGYRAESYFYQDGARIEAAFRKHFHRAKPKQTKDSYELMVCHANVIRYFVCRALQLPPEAWLRISLNHGSITWLIIYPNGRVVLRQLGETGHIPPEFITRN